MAVTALKMLAISILLAVPPGSDALARAVLPDQHGGHDSLAAHRGTPVVVLVVDARRMGSVRRWAEDLLARLPRLRLLLIADVNEARPVTLERVSEVLARRVPAEARVLIDMQRLWAEQFGLDTAVPNLFVVDARGDIVAQWRGHWSAELAQAVVDNLATLAGDP